MALLSNLRLGRKIGLLTLAALVFGLAAFSTLAIQSINESLQKTLQERLTIARIVANNLDQTLNYILAQLRDAARATGGLPTKAEFDREMAPMREILRESGIRVNTLYVLDSTGKVIIAEPDAPGIVGFSMSAYSEIKKNLDAGTASVSGLVTKPLTETPTVLISVPIINERGEICGVLVSTIDTEQSSLGAFTQSFQVGQTGYIEVVDASGIVVARTGPGTPPESFELSDHPTRFAELINTGQAVTGKCHRCHTTATNVKKQRDVLAFAPLATVPWGVVIRQSEQEALLPTRQLEIRLLILGTVLVLITLVLVWAMMQNIVKPIRMLTTAANSLAKNDYEVAIPIGRGDEIGNLSAAFQVMRDELRESRREIVSRYEEAKHREELRGQLLNSVIDAQEQERRRIARELHDEYGQTLTGLIMSIEAVEDKLPPDQSRLKERLTATKTVVAHALDEMRRLILDLRPPSLDELGLVTAIKTYAQRHLADLDINLKFESHNISGRFPPTLEVTVFRIVQEALHNVAKHAHARNVSIRLSVDGDKMIAVVEDDGHGFNTDVVFRSGGRGHAWGLIGIRERAALMGGKFELDSKIGRGTRLEVEIPVDASRWGDSAISGETPATGRRKK
ncbi:MAG: histidine kinase [Dehalococcoidia bacterium]|nr:histidine kinase [Dehalococcoidia bacterium]